MKSSEGGFYSASDADSEGVEGKFFVWTKDEIEQILGKQDSEWLAQVYPISAEGNFEGDTILHRDKGYDELQATLAMSQKDFFEKLTELKKKLYEVREKRIAPITDDKIIASWNGLVIRALAKASFVLARSSYLKVAEDSMGFVLSKLRGKEKLFRSYRNGKTDHRAFLPDYASTILALIALFEQTGKAKYLTEARSLQAILDLEYWDEKEGGYFKTSSKQEELLSKEKPYYDGAEPSGNSLALEALRKLYAITLEEEYRKKSEKLVQFFAGVLSRGSHISPMMTASMMALSRPRIQIVLCEGSDETQNEKIEAALSQVYVPEAVVIRKTEEIPALEVLNSKVAQSGQTTVYICINEACKLPVTDAVILKKELLALRPI